MKRREVNKWFPEKGKTAINDRPLQKGAPKLTLAKRDGSADRGGIWQGKRPRKKCSS
jgi:hypothetical protein